jgi:hypothetical protein
LASGAAAPVCGWATRRKAIRPIERIRNGPLLERASIRLAVGFHEFEVRLRVTRPRDYRRGRRPEEPLLFEDGPHLMPQPSLQLDMGQVGSQKFDGTGATHVARKISGLPARATAKFWRPAHRGFCEAAPTAKAAHPADFRH